jgi:hypothetical protein
MNHGSPAGKAKRRIHRPNEDCRDPLLYGFDLPLTGTYHPLGFTFQIATNSREVLLAAEESWRHFKKRFAEPPVHFRLGISESKSRKCPPIPVVKGHRDIIASVADARNFVVSNGDFAFGWLTKAAAAHRAYLRYCFLEATFYVLTVPTYLAPIHGACVSHRGSGVLLCGDSQAGKSSLAYACARCGWSFLCDDATYLVRERPGRIVIGNPYQIRFRESAMEFFPELRHQRLSDHLSGKLSIELVTSSLPQITLALETRVDFIVMLNRRPGPATLVRRSRESVRDWFASTLAGSPPEVRQLQRASLENLLTADIFELRYSDFSQAIAQLESMVHTGPSVPAEFAFAGGSTLNV